MLLIFLRKNLGFFRSLIDGEWQLSAKRWLLGLLLLLSLTRLVMLWGLYVDLPAPWPRRPVSYWNHSVTARTCLCCKDVPPRADSRAASSIQMQMLVDSVTTGYVPYIPFVSTLICRTAGVGKRVRGTSLYHSRQRGVVRYLNHARIGCRLLCDARLQPAESCENRIPVGAGCV